MISAEEALERLRAGNDRFVAGLQNDETQSHHVRRMLTAERQSPFAIVLGCSDSRVPAEIIFDQGLGDLFVIRVAGNIVAPSQIGSVEFAVSRFDTPLVVVLGHSQCGAVLATLDSLRDPPGKEPSDNSRSILDRIRPVVENLVGEVVTDDPAAIVDAAVRANILASVGHLRHGSNLLEKLIGEEKLRIVGAEYSLETGAVSFVVE
jgi:carbonic anhydrase